jgi:hypothetical protein
MDKYIKLTCLPNLPVLGPKFKGNNKFKDIREKIVKLNTEEIKNIKEKGEI